MIRTRQSEKKWEGSIKGSFLMVDKRMIELYGLQLAVYMINLIDKYNYFKKRFPENNGEFFLTHAQQMAQTGLSKHVLLKNKQKAMDNGWFVVRYKGQPAKQWYDVNIEHPDIQSVIGSSDTQGSEFQIPYKETIKKNKNDLFTSIDHLENITTPKDKEIVSSKNLERVVRIFNKKSFPKILKLSPSRRNRLSALINEYSHEKVIEVINEANKSDFLKGKNERGWVATFDWIMKTENFIKIMEGNYQSSSNQIANKPKYIFDQFSGKFTLNPVDGYYYHKSGERYIP